DLVGAIQLLVYVGGTLVLVVFGVMLTAQGPFISMKTSSAEWAISATVGLLLLGVLVLSVARIEDVGPPREEALAKYAPHRPPPQSTKGSAAVQAPRTDTAKAPFSSIIGQGFLGVGVGPVHLDEGPVRMHYLLPFELVSVHLLVVLIGAAYLARAKRRRRP